MASPTTAARNPFRLPPELLDAILSRLPNSDIKSLRLTCQCFCQHIQLRISRVFLSANPLNIKVCRAIADHEVYRKGVVELIWDDAHIERPPTILKDDDPCENCSRKQRDLFKLWFEVGCRDNLDNVKGVMQQHGRYPGQEARARWMAAEPPFELMARNYFDLFNQQVDIMTSSEDANVLKYALERFPSLRKITLTPAAHGAYFTPLYETPMIRAFPYGFNWPTPRGWPVGKRNHPVRINGWSDSKQDGKEKNRWRGFRIIAWTLAHHDHNISEFVVDSKLLNTGLNGHIFDQLCDDYINFASLLLKPGFRRIDLSLLVGGQDQAGWPMFRSHHLRDALSQAVDLEHVSISTNAHSEFLMLEEENNSGNFIPLLSVFPIGMWPKIKHIGLPGFIVQIPDLISFLSALPKTVQSIDLSFILIQKDHGTHRELLLAMRDKLDWGQRAIGDRPRIIMGRYYNYGVSLYPGQAVWVDDEVNEFIYGQGENPFEEERPNDLYASVGTMRDVFDPANEKLTPLDFWDNCFNRNRAPDT